jgi:hypothetical protein
MLLQGLSMPWLMCWRLRPQVADVAGYVLLQVYPSVTLPSTMSLLTAQKLTWLFLKK